MCVYVYIAKIEKGLMKEQERKESQCVLQTFSAEFKKRVLIEAVDLEIANVLQVFCVPQEFLCVVVKTFSNSHKL